jgi:hypothetical protein
MARACERTIQQEGTRVEHDLVVTLRELLGNVTSSLQTTELQEALVLPHGITDELCRLRLTLRTDNNTLNAVSIPQWMCTHVWDH